MSMIRYGQDWEEMYQCDPTDFAWNIRSNDDDTEDAEDKKNRLIIGGEACMWGEYVDATNFMPRLWLVI